MGTIAALLFLLILPPIGIIILYNKYGQEYGLGVLIIFLLTVLFHMGFDSFVNDYTKYASPCNNFYNPILFQLLFTDCHIVSDYNNIPLHITERIIDWGFFFEELLLGYLIYWPAVLLILWGILKAIIDKGWTPNQWMNYASWNVVIFIILKHFSFLVSLF